MKKIKNFYIVFSSLLIFISGAFFFLIFTTPGAELLVRRIVPGMLGVKKVYVGRIRGSLARQINCDDFRIDVSRWVPGGGTLRAETVDVIFAPFSDTGSDVRVKDVTLTANALGGSEMRLNVANILFEGNDFRKPVIFLQQGWLRYSDIEALLVSARLSAERVQANIYVKYIALPGVLETLAQAGGLRGVTGSIVDLDLYVKGSLDAPEFSGTFKLPRIVYEKFSAVDCVGDFACKLKVEKKPRVVSGQVNFEHGRLNGSHAVQVEIGRSSISFSKGPEKPRLDMQGRANIEGVAIAITLKGSVDEPDLRLSSEPPMPQERLLVMLVTGKKWSAVEDSLTKNTITPDMAAELVDYFVLGGSAANLARRLGLSDISLKLDKESSGVSVKKDVTDKAQVKYSVEQSRSEPSQQSTTQKVGGEIRLVPGVSVSAEKEIKSREPSEEGTEKKTDDTVMLKWKKEF